MQLQITLLLIAIAACYTAYEFWRSCFPSPSANKDCGHGCGKCSQVQMKNDGFQNEKGEPVTLVPLQMIHKH